MARIARGTSASAERGKTPCWYFWRSHILYVCAKGHTTTIRFANGSGAKIRSDGLVMGQVYCASCDETDREMWLEHWICY